VYQEGLGKFLELACCFVAIGTSILNVILGYIEPVQGNLFAIFNRLDYIACCYFLFLFIIKWYLATHRI
jgi:hypothetical protein